MKVAVSYLCCDRPDLVEQSLPPLIAGATKQQFHLFVIDGSKTGPGEKAVFDIGYPTAKIHSNVNGGAGAAIVYALSLMLDHEEQYDYVGLCEADVLLDSSWFDSTFGLFQRGLEDGLEVGVVSARCYEDRILLQRDGYACCHNLGAGHVLFTRAAAEVVLRTFRTAWTSDNRRIFSQLSGQDIGTFWAFRLGEHYLTADFQWEVALARVGLASLALTPSPVEMIGQNPPLAEQGLAIVREPVLATDPPTARTLDVAFETYATRLARIRDYSLQIPVETQFHFDPNTGSWTYFPHQMHMLGGAYSGDWHLKEARGWGTFAWLAGKSDLDTFGTPTKQDYPSLTVPVFGPVAVLVSGGEIGARVEVTDEHSGYRAVPDLPPEGAQGQVAQLMVPGAFAYRNIRIAALTPGLIFYGIQNREKQPFDPNATFRYSNLPPV